MASGIPVSEESWRKTVAGMKTEDTGGLERVLELGVGCRVMVRKNLNDDVGLVNGAVGDVTRLEWSADGRTIEAVVLRLLSTGAEHRLVRISATFALHKTSAQYISRTQFCIILAYAITVHKSQVSP